MRHIFAIWSDDGRVDYGPTHPKLPHARRFGFATVAFAVAGVGAWSAYSAIIGNPKVDDSSEVRDPAGSYSARQDVATENPQVANAVATSMIGTDSSTARSSARTKRRVQPKAIGLVPIGAPDGLTTTEPRLAAGTIPNPAVVFADQSVRAAADSTDRGSPKFAENSSDAKLRVAKKKPTHRVSPVQVYELADGRQVTVRRSARNDKPAAVTDFDRRDSNFANAPPFGRRVRVAWPWFFEPF